MRENANVSSGLNFLVVVAWCALSTPLVAAAVPHLIRYQGQAVDSLGVPVEGPHTLTFRLYDAATAGTTIWEEVQPKRWDMSRACLLMVSGT